MVAIPSGLDSYGDIREAFKAERIGCVRCKALTAGNENYFADVFPSFNIRRCFTLFLEHK